MMRLASEWASCSRSSWRYRNRIRSLNCPTGAETFTLCFTVGFVQVHVPPTARPLVRYHRVALNPFPDGPNSQAQLVGGLGHCDTPSVTWSGHLSLPVRSSVMLMVACGKRSRTGPLNVGLAPA